MQIFTVRVTFFHGYKIEIACSDVIHNLGFIFVKLYASWWWHLNILFNHGVCGWSFIGSCSECFRANADGNFISKDPRNSSVRQRRLIFCSYCFSERQLMLLNLRYRFVYILMLWFISCWMWMNHVNVPLHVSLICCSNCVSV